MMIKRHAAIFLFLFFYAAVIGYKLIAAPTFFYDWDESLYIQTGKEMFERAFFWFPVWQGQPWLDKPPLVPFFYGAVMKIFFFIPPEISTRLFTLAFSIVVLIFIYLLFLRASKEKWVSFLAAAAVAFTPIFLQRAQVVNLDVFLLFGWLGYILFFNRFWLSVFFLMVAVLSKSLLGFYPIAMMSIFYLKKEKKRLVFHALIGASWFILMLFTYREQFFTQHIVESHFKRVTASIESHFGKRTFYVDLIMQEFGVLIWLAIPGAIWIVLQLRKHNFLQRQLAYSVYLLPWFVFLNLTKTKIFWYIYPAVPQFAYLAALPLMFFKKTKILYYMFGAVFFVFVLFDSFITRQSVQKIYANNSDAHYQLSVAARRLCDSLAVVEGPDSRRAYATLSRLGLVITTTHWWGSHPSIVYYFGKEVDFIYAESALGQTVKDCIAVSADDQIMLDVVKKKKAVLLNAYGNYRLFQSR